MNQPREPIILGGVESVQAGLPRSVTWEGRAFQTSVFKSSVLGPTTVSERGLAGDSNPVDPVEASKAVYAYFSRHYPFWEDKLGLPNLPFGSFGENLTLSGLDESTIHVGDLFQIGSVVLAVTEPRVPCYDLNVKFDCKDIVKQLLASGQSGAYFSVIKEGMLEAGDSLVLKSAHPGRVAIQTVYRLYVGAGSRNDYDRVVSLDALSDSWRTYFQQMGHSNKLESR